ncbi:hypothetical protein [Bartonella sp. AA1HLJMS]
MDLSLYNSRMLLRMGLGKTLREISLKQVREFATQWHSVFT